MYANFGANPCINVHLDRTTLGLLENSRHLRLLRRI